MIKITLTILLTLICWISTIALRQDKAPAQELPLLTFTDLQRNDSIEGTFRIVGYVLDIYKCPPCPPGAMCKPCIPDNIVVTDNIEEKDFSRIKRLRISTDKPEQFELKKKYSFTVKIKGKVPPGRAISDVELVSFEPVKE